VLCSLPYYHGQYTIVTFAFVNLSAGSFCLCLSNESIIQWV
jgi:hypothetical protein